MRRDDWTLNGKIRTNDEVMYELVQCKVIKVKGTNAVGEEGNVLIEIGDKRIWVLGSKLTPIKEGQNERQ